MMLWIQETPVGIRFKVRVQPRAAQNTVCGLLDGALKIRLTAPPVDGEANAACVQFLAKSLGVSRAAVRLVAGEKARTKMIEVKGFTAARLRQLVDSLPGCSL
ncbi:MAG: DUF167 domain-containing protein [Heliobacteriaceae bacterium]|nr:DUF167 domain-containing protein [Heliobacteriaceae bacterium]MDD4587469.1 DUF167 domain-containing protein [Heliobacteriaceae bacterium]